MATKGKVSVKVRNGNLDNALKYFKNKVMETGVLQEYKERQEYIKPSVKKRKKKKEAIWKQKIYTRDHRVNNV